MELEIIKQLYNEFLMSKYKYITNKDYYEGRHSILYDYALQDARSNLKCVVNYCKRFIDERVSYISTNAVNYTSKSGNDKAVELIDNNIGIWDKLHNQNLLKQAQIYGEAYELYYFDEFGEFKTLILNPLNCYVLKNESGKVEIALREYNLKWDNDTYLEVYTANEITTYKVSDFSILESEKHRFGVVPITVCCANEESKSLIDDIKLLNDAYNNVLSDLVNEVSDFRQCFLTVTGAELTKKEALLMRESGIIQIPDSSKIDYLTKQINDTFVQNLLNELEEKMYKTVSTIDSNERMQSNTSSVAIRSRLYLLESACGLIQSYLEQTIRRRLQIFSSIQTDKANKFDYKDINIKFTANIPSDIASLSDSISKLKDVVSQKTLLSLLPFVENVDLEIKQFEEEQNRAFGVNLNDV